MIVYQKRIYRADLQANPDVLYVFGDNVKRVGMAGQAGEMRGEPNAVGIATKWTPGRHALDYFSDNIFNKCMGVMLRDLLPVFDRLRKDGVVVFPMDGIGTGLSELPERAPRLYDWLCSMGLGAQS